MSRMTTMGCGDSSPFSPLSLLPALWLDADDAATRWQLSTLSTPAAANADPVGGWTDKSGNARNVLQAVGGKRPTLVTAAQNGRADILFDAVDDFMSYTGNISPSGSHTIYWAGNVTSTAGYKFILDTNTSAISMAIDNTGKYAYYTAGSWKPLGAAAAGFQILCLTLDATGGTGEIFKNGTSVGSGAYAAAAIAATTAISSNNVGSSFFSGYNFGDFIIFSAAHSVAQRAVMTTYLNTKWAVY